MSIVNGNFVIWLSLVSLLIASCQGFQLQNLSTGRPNTLLRQSASLDEQNSAGLLTVRNYLKTNYGGMNKVFELNDSIWKTLGSSGGLGGFTIFVPKNEALVALGEVKQRQLLDPRNLETSQKVGAYHVIAETVTATELFNAGGVVTLGGEIPIERTTTGGFFGVGGKEDGGVTIGGAKVLRSIELGNGLVHEVDNLVSPNILWRYMDQLRIPGSQ